MIQIKNGLLIILKIEHKKETESEGESYVEREKDEHRAEIKTDLVQMQWENSNPDMEVTPMDPVTFYYSYQVKSSKTLYPLFFHLHKKVSQVNYL